MPSPPSQDAQLSGILTCLIVASKHNLENQGHESWVLCAHGFFKWQAWVREEKELLCSVAAKPSWMHQGWLWVGDWGVTPGQPVPPLDVLLGAGWGRLCP